MGGSVTTLMVAAAEDGLGWAQVAMAALGSSVIGAVVGGLLTTWLRGRIEREEAWRTRLIEAADDVASELSQADLDFNAILIGDVAESRQQLHNPDGTLTQEVSNSMRASMQGIRKANKLLTRVELLYGRDSVAHREALATVYGLSGSVRLLGGNARAQRAVQAVLADRRDDRQERDRLIARDEVAASRYKALMSEQGLPQNFDPSVDASVAAWALKLHDAAVTSFHQFMKGAYEASRAEHPGRRARRLL